jgi:DNA-binding NarL/FixJ family response regulator
MEEFIHIEVLFEACDYAELIAKLEEHQPDVIFMDIQMPEVDGIEATSRIKKKYPDIKVIILTMHNERELVSHALNSGANGFLTKNSDIDAVVNSIDEVINSGYYFADPSECEKVLVPKEKCEANISDLSPREIEVVHLMCRQFTNKEIAEQLRISPRTVDTYRENIFSKTGAKNLAGVVFYAIKHNLLDQRL